MNPLIRYCSIVLLAYSTQGAALSFSPDEFQASRKLACVLAQQSLGQLSEDEYGAKTHTVLDGFDETEREHILAQAVGYFGGLMYSSASSDEAGESLRLEEFLASNTCDEGEGYSKVTLRL